MLKLTNSTMRCNGRRLMISNQCWTQAADRETLLTPRQATNVLSLLYQITRYYRGINVSERITGSLLYRTFY